ncbi:MAG: hypothetical protein GY854_21285 [Deltaproteobacteria bacterium]|nr:hypothetical protein [Deltaproteobacteria bacterium]
MMFLGFKKKTRVSELKAGVEAIVEGEVVSRNVLTISGSGTRCVYYDKMNESFEVGARGRGRRMWVPKNLERRCAGFFIEDGESKVWVTNDTDGLEVAGGHQEGGVVGKKGRTRYTAQYIQGGDRVRIKGLVCEPKGADPADGLVLRPNRKGILKIKVG